ncbi:MAG: zinc-ribbon domain-containing protein [Bacillota bacterium]
MYCPHCGAEVSEGARFCRSCGQPQTPELAATAEVIKPVQGGSVGFSPKISDPAFAKYVQNSNRWAAIFSLILAVMAVVGFYIAGEMGSSDLENPQALYIGLGIGAMFVVIAMAQIRSRNRSKSWDGQVVDKRVEKKRRRQRVGNDEYHWEEYLLYRVIIRSDEGKLHEMRFENDDTVYNYWRLGDRLRYHGGLCSYEKYDKSQDTFVFCNACSAINEITNDTCVRCHCPLLK